MWGEQMKTLAGSKYYKYYVEQLIKIDPKAFTIIRKTKVPNGYKGHTIVESTIPGEGMIYEARGRREVLTDYGKTYTGISINKLLMRGNADILKGDLLEIDGTKYEVFLVKDYFEISKQVELEVME